MYLVLLSLTHFFWRSQRTRIPQRIIALFLAVLIPANLGVGGLLSQRVYAEGMEEAGELLLEQLKERFLSGKEGE